MKYLLIKLLYFFCPVLLIYVILALFVIPKLAIKTEGPNTESKIKNSFQNAKNRNYDLLILGNSGTYRGIDPDILAISSYNFSHDNDSYNQMYYKLKWLEQQNKQIKYLILGVDYFQFNVFSDSRNYVYSSLFSDEYSKDYTNTNPLNVFLSKTNILEFDRMKLIFNVFRIDQNVIFQKNNGQFIKPGKALQNDKHIYSIKRLPIQEKYFAMILDYCTKNEIEVFMCMLPARKNALINYRESDIQEFNRFIHNYTNNRIHFLNYSHQTGWSLDDYTDITHLNEKAANKFTKQLNDAIMHILKRKNVQIVRQ